MKHQQIANDKKSTVLTLTGIIVMILLAVTKVVPSSQIAGYSVFVGIAFFFITEAAETGGDQSGLRFHTIVADLKKPGVVFWLLLPVVSGLAALVVGKLLFSGKFVAHVLGRTGSILSFAVSSKSFPSIFIRIKREAFHILLAKFLFASTLS